MAYPTRMRPTILNVLVARRMTIFAVVTITMSLVASLIAGAGQRPAYQQSGAKPLLLAITPDLMDQSRELPWDALATHISERSGRLLRIVQPGTLDEFESCLATQAYDLVLAFPHQISSAIPLVQLRHKPRGLIAVRSDSRFFSLADLEGAEIAMPDAGSLAGTRLARAELAAMAKRPRVTSVPDTGAGYDAVLFGEVAATSGTPHSFNGLPEHVRNRLRVIHQTERFAPAIVHVVHNVSDHVQYRLAEAFSTLRRAAPALHARSPAFEFESITDTGQGHGRNTLHVPHEKVHSTSGCPVAQI